jgi:hypothetical protein
MLLFRAFPIQSDVPAIDIACFMIASQEEHFVGQLVLHGQQVGNALKTI